MTIEQAIEILRKYSAWLNAEFEEEDGNVQLVQRPNELIEAIDVVVKYYEANNQQN